MPGPFNYNVEVPSVLPALQMVAEGLQARRERMKEEESQNLARNIGGQIAGGDMSGAATTAFNAGDLATGLDLTKLSRDQQIQAGETIAKLAASANTPEAWEQLRPRLTKLTGVDPGDFATGRQELIAEGATLPQILDMQESSAKRADKAREAPDIIEIGDPANPGKKIKAQWNSATRKFEPLGSAYGGDKNGVTTRVLPDGTIETIVGGPANPLTKPVQGQVQGKAIDAAEMGSRVSGIMEGFKPEYQTLGTRFANLWRSTKARVDPESLGKDEQKQLEDFAKFRSQAIGNVNRLLNELSGAAVSPAEGERLKAEMPNPGTGLFDGDDPVSFRAKMENVMNQVERALARYEYYQMFGTPGSIEDVPLNNAKKVNGKWYVKGSDGKIYEIGDAAKP